MFHHNLQKNVSKPQTVIQYNPILDHNLLQLIAVKLRFYDLLNLRLTSKYILSKLPKEIILRQRHTQYLPYNPYFDGLVPRNNTYFDRSIPRIVSKVTRNSFVKAVLDQHTSKAVSFLSAPPPEPSDQSKLSILLSGKTTEDIFHTIQYKFALLTCLAPFLFHANELLFYNVDDQQLRKLMLHIICEAFYNPSKKTISISDKACGHGFAFIHWLCLIGEINLLQTIFSESQNTNLLIKKSVSGVWFRKNLPNKGSEPIDFAAWSGHLDIVKLLVKLSIQYKIELNFGSALVNASKNGHTLIVSYLLSQNIDLSNENVGLKALSEAAENGFHLTVKCLLEAGVNPNPRNSQDTDPLLLATRFGHIHIMSMLLDYNANIDIKDEGSDVPRALYTAVRNNNSKAVLLLLQRGSSPQGGTLYAAAYRGYVNICKILLQYGADMSYKTMIMEMFLKKEKRMGFFGGFFGMYPKREFHNAEIASLWEKIEKEKRITLLSAEEVATIMEHEKVLQVFSEFKMSNMSFVSRKSQFM